MNIQKEQPPVGRLFFLCAGYYLISTILPVFQASVVA